MFSMATKIELDMELTVAQKLTEVFALKPYRMMLEIEAAARLRWSPKLSGLSSISKISLLILSKSQSAWMRARHGYALLDILNVQESGVQILGR
jgi:hypothetical protein